MSRSSGKLIHSPVASSSGIGPTSIIWCTAGASGIDAPASAATCGLHTPQAITTVSVSISPRSVSTRLTRPRRVSIPVTSVRSSVVSAPACTARSRKSSPARSGSRIAAVGVWKPPRSRDASQKGTSSWISAGETRCASTPQDIAEVMRRVSSCIRSALRATSMPPQWFSTPSSVYWRSESRVRSVISLEWSTGKTKFEAWPVEPPGSGSGPLSSWTMFFQPRSAKWVTAALPTTPAPMTTTSALWGSCTVVSSSTSAGPDTVAARTSC